MSRWGRGGGRSHGGSPSGRALGGGEQVAGGRETVPGRLLQGGGGRSRAGAAGVVIAAQVLGAGWASVGEYFAGDEILDPPAELVEFTPTIAVRTLWTRQVGAGFDQQFLKLRPVVDGDSVYAAERKGEVSAYDASDGARKWRVDTDAALAGGPGIGAGRAVVGTSDGEVIALGVSDGAIAWRVRVSSEVLAQPRIADGLVIVRTVDGKLYALEAATGKRVWVYDRNVPVLTLRGTSSPALAADTVVAGFDSGRLVALALADAQVLWETRIAVPRGRSELERLVDIDADPVIDDGSVYVVTFHGRVAALDLLSGEVVWQRDMSSHAGLALDRSQLYVTDENGHVWALDRKASSSTWKQRRLEFRGVTAPVVYRDWVVVGDAEGYVHFLRREDGQFAARVRVDSDGISAAPVVAGDILYVYGIGGELAALDVAP